MTPTRPRTLLLVALVTGLVTYVLFRWRYSSLPPVPVTAAVSTAGLAVAELFLAPGTRARLQGRPGTKPIMPIAVARIAALAKASSALGAVMTGVWVGIGAYVLPRWDLAPTPRRDTIRALVGLGSALLLVVAALRLENVCRVPPPPPEAEPGR